MRKWVWIAMTLLMVPWAMAVGKKPTATDVEPESLTPFTGAALLVRTNAQGQVANMEVLTSSSRYKVLTNGIDALTLKGLAKINDKPVDFKGEIAQVSNVLCVRVVGPIKDVTPSLSGVSMRATKTEDKGKVSYMIQITAGKYLYTVSQDKVEPAVLDGLVKLNGKLVDVEGEILQSTMSIRLTGSVKEARGSKKPEKEKEKEKKPSKKSK